MKDSLEYATEFFVECGLMRAVDAAEYLGISRQTFIDRHLRDLRTFQYKDRKYYSFLEVFELSVQYDLKFDRKRFAEEKAARKIVHVERLDHLRTKLKTNNEKEPN